jgi:hypothetical protein
VFGKNVKSPVMNMAVAIFGLQQTVLPARNFSRFILMMFLIFCLVNRNVYQGALYLFLQSDGRHKDIKSVDEMEEMNFNYYVFESYIDIVHNQSRIFKKKIVVRDEKELPFAKEVNENLKAAFMTPQTEVIDRNRINAGKFSLKVCAEQVSVINVAIFFTRSFYLKTEIDMKLRQFDAAGLLTYWINKHADKKYLSINEGVTGPKKLNMEHLFGVFNIMLIGHAVALIIFIFEVMIFRIKQMRLRKHQARIIIVTPKI